MYKKGKLIFADEQNTPKDGTVVIVTFSEDLDDEISAKEAIVALRGRGKGEGLVEKLLQSRKEDLKCDERSYKRLRP